ncbi:hypothetical protein TWF694_003097 [Orbilia ellipsospora]|uniref:RING-type domain-containing protein n=1 Tax=Orbilia ellipsospora TaxID=2528407 RepID=A0AAV9X0X1_9PEZI
MSYRDGGGYGHGGYHSDLPPAQLGDISIDPDEFPAVAQHLAGLHIGGSSTGGSTGYPEDGARHIFVGSNGHYYTNEVPTSTATYSGYGYIPAPESSTSAPPHAFAGALRSPVDSSSSFTGMGYTYGYSVGPLSPSMNTPQPSQLYNTTAPGTPTIQYYPRPSFPYNMSPAPASAQSPFPPPTQLSLPPASPSVASTPSLPRPEGLFQNRRFSYDDGTAANLHSHIRHSYDQYMQDYEARERYDSFATHDEPTRGRRPAANYYRPSGEYTVPAPAGSIPRNSTKTPGHGGDAGPRRPPLGIAAVHQTRPPNSRHSSSESGDAEPPYPSGPYDEYGNPGRPKTSKSRPHSFSYPDRYYKLGIEADDHDPRSSSGSLGGSGVRHGSTTMVTQPDRYHRDSYADRGAIIHPSNSRVGRSYHPRNPQDNSEGTVTYIATDESADERRRRHRSKSRYRGQTPGPDSERPYPSEDGPRAYRIVTKSRPASPSPPPRRAKSRRRHASPSPDGYRSKSHLRSKSRPRPEIIQSTRPEILQQPRPEIIQSTRSTRTESPRRGETPGSSRPKTPMPEPSGSDLEQNLRLREIDRELDRIQRDRTKLEKMSREREVMMETYRRQQEEEMMIKQAQAAEENLGKEPERRHKSRHRASSRSTSNERTERDTDRESRKEKTKEKERSRRDREKDKDGERESRRDKTRDKKEERERDKVRDSYREEERSRDKRSEEPPQSKPEPAKVTDPALANPMVENLNPRRERAGIQPGQSFIRPDLMCAMNALGLCIVEQDPSDDHAHNRLLRLDCGHGYHEDCLRSTISSKERIPMDQVDLEAEKLWCERCRNVYGKKAGR